MITASDIRNKRFEKAAFGYKQEDIDEFLTDLEKELTDIDSERDEANNKIQILADKVRAFAQLRYFLVNFHAEVKFLLVKIAVR